MTEKQVTVRNERVDIKCRNTPLPQHLSTLLETLPQHNFILFFQHLQRAETKVFCELWSVI